MADHALADSDWYEERIAIWENRQAASEGTAAGDEAVRHAILDSREGSPAPERVDGASTSAAATAAPTASSPGHGRQEVRHSAQPGEADGDTAVASTSGRNGVVRNGEVSALAEAAAGEQAEAVPSVIRMDGGFSMLAATYDRLFPYQQVGVKWMWELHLQRAGGA